MRKAGAPRVRVRWGRKHTGVEYRLWRSRHLIAINTKRFIIKLGQLSWKRALERFLLQNFHHLGPQAPSSGYRSDSTWRKPARQSHHPVGPSQVVCYALFCTTDARVAPLALSHSQRKGGISGGSRRPPVLCCPQDRQTTVDGNLLHSERVHRPCFLLHDGPCVPPFPPPHAKAASSGNDSLQHRFSGSHYKYSTIERVGWAAEGSVPRTRTCLVELTSTSDAVMPR
jgi:hypothetical protein